MKKMILKISDKVTNDTLKNILKDKSEKIINKCKPMYVKLEKE
jgi:hypothetical protein